MPRYIDADGFFDNFPELDIVPYNTFPATDVVEVVRCKDCKFYSLNDGGGCTRSGGLEYLITSDEYCSKGERKEKTDD